ncbi:MAG: hypothetical protein EOM23_10940 [Candidatus Moranbacteria bacterium]|nr:hypothetical protein [Candidatus Moranbacteria bacterium]
MNPVNLNKYLKELGQILGFDRVITRLSTQKGELVKKDYPLWALLTTHVGRRTFISLSIALNINSSILMRFVGHRSTEMLDHYTGTSDDMKRREMENFTRERLLKIS